MSAPSIPSAPRVVLSPSDVDLLELALAGGVPEVPFGERAADPESGTVLLDSENTPLAHVVEVTRDGRRRKTLRPLRPFVRCQGAHCDPAFRAGPRQIVARLGGPPAATVVVDAVPSRGDVRRLAELADGTDGPLLVVLPVSRESSAPTIEPIDGPGLVRAGVAAVDRVVAAAPGNVVVPLVLPWPADPSDAEWFDGSAVDLDSVLETYGVAVGSARMLSGMRPPAEVDAAARLAGAWERVVAERYPEESAVELVRGARAGTTRGAVVLLTGLSGSGKSTLARALAEDLQHRQSSHGVTLLDGDEVRRHLSQELGFDAAARETNVRRIGYVASLIASHGGIAIAAPIAPFASGRDAVRQMVPPGGTFLLVHVSTPLEVCESRDRKGMYARARAGDVAEFTGISSPYEVPDDADVVIDTSQLTVPQSVELVRAALLSRLDAVPQR